MGALSGHACAGDMEVGTRADWSQDQNSSESSMPLTQSAHMLRQRREEFWLG